MRILIALFMTLVLAGCQITMKHEMPLNVTNSLNGVEVNQCRSHALDELLELEPVDVAAFKKRRDINGLLKALANRIKEQERLANVSRAELGDCVELKVKHGINNIH